MKGLTNWHKATDLRLQTSFIAHGVSLKPFSNYLEAHHTMSGRITQILQLRHNDRCNRNIGDQLFAAYQIGFSKGLRYPGNDSMITDVTSCSDTLDCARHSSNFPRTTGSHRRTAGLEPQTGGQSKSRSRAAPYAALEP